MDICLFRSSRGEATKSKFREALRSVGASECDILYIHSGMPFGLPALKRGQLLGEMLDTLENLGVPTIIFPTFTFSFCNNEDYDVQNSASEMGALNEYARKTGRGIRSEDPLLSVYALGNPLNLVSDLGPYSIGRDSNYDRLHNSGKEVKFLFIGADMNACFTYNHYMEAIFQVPYRYDREFTGDILNDGIKSHAKAYLYSTYANCRLNSHPVVHDAMSGRHQLNKTFFGDGEICCFSEKDAYKTIADLFSENIYCLTDGNFDPDIKDTTYNKNNERIVSVR